MAKQYEFDWARCGEAIEEVKSPSASAASQPLEQASFRALPDSDDEPDSSAQGRTHQPFADLPDPVPLPEAIGRGVFGREGDAVIEPSVEEVAAITEQQGDRLVELLAQLVELKDALANASGDTRAKLYREKDRLDSAYRGALGMYAEDFGEQAAAQLEAWAQEQLHAESLHGYDAGHPWHYLAKGDDAAPIPAGQIPPAPTAGLTSMVLPKHAVKRTEKLQAMLNDQREQLDRDTLRYKELVEHGVDALSEYDRNIAHGNEDEAWASAIALKYNHISSGLARVAWLEDRLKQSPTPKSSRRRSGKSG